ncbi:bacteriorhodopsin [Sphingomonas jinjuensis]|uniref:Bacteriorhodopsin n=1 Tax=Sphingomonas jinjuensis TaxID=535907 RepID=A0A840FC48_9SPHN|nr:bacteriorhodopsin [Sphingomonas jinjuensis]MBB4154222.1 bacteriorhodopsin [Sphingomonas jinjuensis]
MDQTAFLIGFAIMSLASLAIYAKGSKAPPARHHTLLHAAVPFIAATAYLAMAFGIGTLVKGDGTATYLARYLDWSVTTPILLAGLVLTAFHERGRTGEVGGYLTSIIVLDVLMIVAGLVSSLAAAPVAKWVWYLWSCVAFVGVLYLLWGPLRATVAERGKPLAIAYGKNISFLTVIWFLYPIVFLVGPEGLKMISDPTSVWAILIMDVVAKVAYAFYAAANLDKALGEGPSRA